MNPQQPMQDSGVAPSPEQPSVGGEPAAVAPQISQPEVVPQTQPPQVDSFSTPAPVAMTVQPEPMQGMPVQPDIQSNSSPIAVQPVAAPALQPASQPVITPSAGLAPSSPGIPTAQPPTPPTVAQGTVGTGGLAMSSYSMPDASSKKQKIIKFGVIGGAIVVLLAAGLLGFSMWKSSQIALETYEGEGYTIQVPVGYVEKEEEDGSVTFSEATEEADEQSVLNIAASKAPESTTDKDIEQLKSFLTEEQISEAIETSDEPIFKDVANIQLKTVDNEDEFAVTGTADIKEDEKVTGKIYVEVRVTAETVSTIVIRADASDPGLDNKAQTIIDSLKFE